MSDQKDDFEFDDEFDDDLAFDELDDDFEFDDDLAFDEAADVPSVNAGTTEPQGKANTHKIKKNIPLSFNTIVIGGAVVLGGLVLYFQVLGNKNTAPQEQRFVSSLSMEGPTETIDSRIADTLEEDTSDQLPVLEQGGFLNDMSEIPGEELVDESVSELPMPTPMSQESGQVTQENSIVDSLEFLSDLSEPKIEQSVNDTEQLPALDMAIEPPPSTEGEEMASLLDQNPTPQGADLSQEPNLNQNNTDSNSVPNDMFQAIDQKLDGFGERFGALEEKIDLLDAKTSQRTAILEESVKSIEKKVASVQSSPKKAVRAPKVNKSTSIKAPAPKIEWKLKAAQPGKAWVSQKGQTEIKPIKVGDTISGIGRITSIQFNNESWTVSGTKGKILQ